MSSYLFVLPLCKLYTFHTYYQLRLVASIFFLFFCLNYISQTVHSGFSWVSTSPTSSTTSPSYNSGPCTNIKYTITASETFDMVNNGAPYNSNSVLFPSNINISPLFVDMTISFNQTISNLRIRFVDLDENVSGFTEPEESISMINPPASSVTPFGGSINPFFLSGGIVTPLDNNPNFNNNDASGWVNWTGSLSTVSFRYNRPGSLYALIIDSIYFDCPTPSGCTANAIAGPDVNICNNQPTTLNASSSTGNQFTWSNGSSSSSISVSTPGTYWVSVSNGTCSDTDTVIVTAQTYQPNVLNDALTTCPNEVFTLNASSANATSYLWNNGQTTSSINTSNAGTYWVQVSNGSCSYKDTIIVTNQAVAFSPIPASDYICANDAVTVNAIDNSAVSYLWSTGETTSSITVIQAGLYWVERTNVNGCKQKDFISILELTNQDTETSFDKCKGESLILTSSQGSATNYLWNNGSTNGSLVIYDSGVYIVTTTNNCGTSTDKYTVVFNECDCGVYIPNTFTPDEDEFNQVFKIKTDCSFYDFHLEIYNRWGEIVFESYDADEFWDGNYGIYKAQDGVYTYKVSYVSNLKPDRINLNGHITLLK